MRVPFRDFYSDQQLRISGAYCIGPLAIRIYSEGRHVLRHHWRRLRNFLCLEIRFVVPQHFPSAFAIIIGFPPIGGVEAVTHKQNVVEIDKANDIWGQNDNAHSVHCQTRCFQWNKRVLFIFVCRLAAHSRCIMFAIKMAESQCESSTNAF